MLFAAKPTCVCVCLNSGGVSLSLPPNFPKNKHKCQEKKSAGCTCEGVPHKFFLLQLLNLIVLLFFLAVGGGESRGWRMKFFFAPPFFAPKVYKRRKKRTVSSSLSLFSSAVLSTLYTVKRQGKIPQLKSRGKILLQKFFTTKIIHEFYSFFINKIGEFLDEA